MVFLTPRKVLDVMENTGAVKVEVKKESQV
jgi:hypothetical protein